MLGSARLDGESRLQLRPFALKLRDSFLIGMTPEPEHGSPCVHCVELWLAARRVWSERLTASELPIRRDLLLKVQDEKNPHLFYEIANDGTETRMECFVYPHPACGCERSQFVSPPKMPARINFAFSPVNQIKCARYGVPNGNLWLTSATGSMDHEVIRVFSTAGDREVSRLRAVEQWMKRATIESMKKSSPVLMRDSSDFITGGNAPISYAEILRSEQCIGAGKNYEEAVASALQEFAKLRTLNKYTTQMKKPMLIVGANNWVRTQVPFFLLQQYDLHLMFYPTSTPTWVVGLAALSRVKTTEPPVFFFESHHKISEALTTVLSRMLEHCRPVDWMSETEEVVEMEESEQNRNRRMGAWWNNWIYRCPKISLKDVLHLEDYPNDLGSWREYLADGQERLKLVEMNSPVLPRELRTLVKIIHPSLEVRPSTNAIGIGTLSSFRLVK